MSPALLPAAVSVTSPDRAPNPARVQRKWRPGVRLILLLLNMAVLSLPIAGLVFLRIYENQLVRETESELIAQAAVIGAVLGGMVAARMPDAATYGRAVQHAPGAGRDATFTPVFPTIDLARDTLLPARPDGEPVAIPPHPTMQAIGQEAAATFQAAQKVTLAGLRLLDPDGIVIGGRGDLGLSFAELPEIRQALTGRYASVIRQRQSDSTPPAITSISRGAQVRVFVAYPVVAGDRLHAIAYLSRTPENVWRRLYEARYRLLIAALATVGIAAGLALIASRTIFGPVDALIRQSEQIAAGRIGDIRPLRHAGSREVARLADSIADMAHALERRSGFIRQFAVHVSHEFKTPLTAIEGATELLSEHDATMSQTQRRTFLRNIADDTERLRTLVERLNQLAKAEGAGQLEHAIDIVAALERLERAEASASLALVVGGQRGAFVRLPEEGLEIIVANLKSNALAAGATRIDVTVTADGEHVRMAFADNGSGIAPRHRARIFEPLFTSRRDSGGTGLGLRIIRSLIEPHGGAIALADSDTGAVFVITLPRAIPPAAGQVVPGNREDRALIRPEGQSDGK